MSKKYNFFTIFLQTKIFTMLTLEKTKRNNDENKPNFAKIAIKLLSLLWNCRTKRIGVKKV